MFCDEFRQYPQSQLGRKITAQRHVTLGAFHLEYKARVEEREKKHTPHIGFFISNNLVCGITGVCASCFMPVKTATLFSS